MAGRLSGVASRIMGGNGVAARSAASALRSRSGMGFPLGKHIVPDKPVKFRPRSFLFPFLFSLFSLVPPQILNLGFIAAGWPRSDLGQRYPFPGTLYRSDRPHRRKGALILLTIRVFVSCCCFDYSFVAKWICMSFCDILISTKRWHGCAEGSASSHRSVCLLSGTTKRPRYPMWVL